jgi:hypothetical protein
MPTGSGSNSKNKKNNNKNNKQKVFEEADIVCIWSLQSRNPLPSNIYAFTHATRRQDWSYPHDPQQHRQRDEVLGHQSGEELIGMSALSALFYRDSKRDSRLDPNTIPTLHASRHG